MTAPGPAPLPLLLRDNPDTVTHLLEALTGEPLVADVVRQVLAAGRSPQHARGGRGQPVTHRIAVLQGGVTMVPYVYAESAYVPGRLPEAARFQLEHTKDPIGRVLAAHGLAHAGRTLPRPGPGPAGAGRSGGRCVRHRVVPRLIG